jgi:hypothetical protein
MEWLLFGTHAAPTCALALAELNRGEAAVIHLALDEQIAIVGIDERRRLRAGPSTANLVSTLSMDGLRVAAEGGGCRVDSMGGVPPFRCAVSHRQGRRAGLRCVASFPATEACSPRRFPDADGSRGQ